MEYASKNVANAGLTTGIIGTALGAMSNGLIPGLFNGGAGENTYVSRFEAGQAARIAELETEVKLRDANTYTDSKILEMYKYVDGKIGCVERELADQRVFNATQIGTISCIQSQISQLMGLTKIVVPNGSVCPGWGDVTVSVTPTSTTSA